MPSIDRGMIKWAPFNSVISGKEVVRSIQNERNIFKMPIFSDEQKQNIENKLIEAFYEQRMICIEYFYADKIVQKTGTIKKIDPTFHKIYFNNQILIFEQILKIN